MMLVSIHRLYLASGFKPEIHYEEVFSKLHEIKGEERRCCYVDRNRDNDGSQITIMIIKTLIILSNIPEESGSQIRGKYSKK